MNGFKKLLILLLATLVVGNAWAGKCKSCKLGTCKSGECKSPEKKKFHKLERQRQLEAFKIIKTIIDTDRSNFYKSTESKPSKIGKTISKIEEELQNAIVFTDEAKEAVAKKRQDLALLKANQKAARALELSDDLKKVKYDNLAIEMQQRIDAIAQKEQEKVEGCVKGCFKTKLYRTTNREFLKAAQAALIKVALLSSHSQKFGVSLLTPNEAADLRLNVINDLVNNFFIVENLKVKGARYSNSVLGRTIKPRYDDNAVTKIIFKYFKPVFYAKLTKIIKFGGSDADLMKQSAKTRIRLAGLPDFYSQNSLWCDQYIRLMNFHNFIYPLASQCWADMKLKSEPKRLGENLNKIKSFMTGVEKKVAESLIAAARHTINVQGRNLNTSALTRLNNDILLIYSYLCTKYNAPKISQAQIQLSELSAINNYCEREINEVKLIGDKASLPEKSEDTVSAYKNLAYVESVKIAMFKLEMVKFRLQQIDGELQRKEAILTVEKGQKRWFFSKTRQDRVIAKIEMLNNKRKEIEKWIQDFDATKSAVTQELYNRFFVEPNLPESPELEFQLVSKRPLTVFDAREITAIVKAHVPEILKPQAISALTKLVNRTETRWFWDLLGGEKYPYDSMLIDLYLRMKYPVLMHLSTLPTMSSTNMRTWVEKFVKTTTLQSVPVSTEIK